MNANADTRQLVEASVRFFREQSGCEAVGIRLRDGDDYPYYEARGFPEGSSNWRTRCASAIADGAIQRDHAGNPVMACMCGNVICGRSPSSHSSPRWQLLGQQHQSAAGHDHRRGPADSHAAIAAMAKDMSRSRWWPCDAGKSDWACFS